MPYTDHNISPLINQLEGITGKKVFLYDEDTLEKGIDVDRAKLDELMERALKLTISSLAVKNLFKQYLKHLTKQLPYIKSTKQIDDILRKNEKVIENKYETFIVEKELKCL